MEEKTNELNDQILDTVSGGAHVRYNARTQQYEVYYKGRIKYGSSVSFEEAEAMKKEAEAIEQNQGTHGIPQYTP